MKKIFMFIVALFTLTTISAQHGPIKFTDNVSIEVKGGVSTPLADMFDGVSPVIGIGAEKYVSPYLGFAIDANALTNNPYGNLNPHTTFDVVNVNLLGKWNMRNTWNYDGTRKFFEPVLFAGVGLGHRTCSEYVVNNDNYFYGKNYLVTKVGAELNFNLGTEKAWAVRVSPAVVWGPCHNGQLNAKNGGFEVTAGVVYHFRNSDGNITFTNPRLYDYDEVARLNETIERLTAERQRDKERIGHQVRDLKRLGDELRRKPKVIRDTVYVNLGTKQFFKVNSADIVSKAAVRDLAKSLNPDTKYVIVGYASEDGSEEYNKVLSENRAENVMNALVEFGVNKDNLTFVGNGETTQFSTDNKEDNRVVVIERK
jgi:outer membrane protein OmpA-like peptidoglycan-associated protein